MTYYRRKARTGLEGMAFDVRHEAVPMSEANDVEPFRLGWCAAHAVLPPAWVRAAAARAARH